MPELTLDKIKSTLSDGVKKLEDAVNIKIKEQSDAANSEIEIMKKGLMEANENLKKLEKEIKENQDAHIPGLRDEAKRKEFSLQKLATVAMKHRVGASDPWQHAGYEKEVLANIRKLTTDQYTKDMMSGDGSSGGFTIAHEAMDNKIIDYTLANLAMNKLNPRKITGLVGNLPIMSITGVPTAHYVGETEAPPKSQISFSTKIMTPKSISAYVPVSEQLIYQSSLDMESLIRDQLSKQLALKVQDGSINGLGTEKQPEGLLVASGLTAIDGVTLGSSGAAKRITVDDLAKMQDALLAADELIDNGNFGYLMNSKVYSGVRRERIDQFSGQTAGTGQPINPMMMVMNLAQVEAAIGYKIGLTSQVANTVTKSGSTSSSNIIFGNFDYLYLGFWRNFRIKISEHATNADSNSAFFNNMLFIKADQDFDVKVAKPTAFCKRDDGETNESNW